MAFNCGEAGCADGCCGSAECLPSARSGCGEIQPSPPAICAAAVRVIEAWESSPLRSHDGMLFERIEDLRAALSEAQAALQALAAEKDAAIAALKLDAARYRWIKADEGDLFRVIQLSVAGHLYDQVIDHAIDSAIALAAKEAK